MNGMRVLAVMVGVVLSVSFLASCSDDDDASPEEAFCSAGDDLRADVESLTDLDLVAEGTNVLEDRFNAIRDDITELKAAGADVAADEIEALEAAVDELGSAIDGLGDEITVDNVGATLDAVGAVGAAASDVFADLSSTCS